MCCSPDGRPRERASRAGPGQARPCTVDHCVAGPHASSTRFLQQVNRASDRARSSLSSVSSTVRRRSLVLHNLPKVVTRQQNVCDLNPRRLLSRKFIDDICLSLAASFESSAAFLQEAEEESDSYCVDQSVSDYRYTYPV